MSSSEKHDVWILRNGSFRRYRICSSIRLPVSWYTECAEAEVCKGERSVRSGLDSVPKGCDELDLQTL